MAPVPDRCTHFAEIRATRPVDDGCTDCRALGETWAELRVCLACGHVGCCDDSPHRHARRHHETTGHAMICSYDPRETWGWCYPHARYFDPMPVALPQRRTLLTRVLDGLIGHR